MEDQGPAARRIGFGPFEFDARSGLLRNGVSEQYLADQPLSLLTALVERPGELVTREELRQRLWPDGTFVGFDHGLNSAINRLREALNDSADTPRFIETIPRRGYRLLVPIVVARPTIPAAVRRRACRINARRSSLCSNRSGSAGRSVSSDAKRDIRHE